MCIKLLGRTAQPPLPPAEPLRIEPSSRNRITEPAVVPNEAATTQSENTETVATATAADTSTAAGVAPSSPAQ